MVINYRGKGGVLGRTEFQFKKFSSQTFARRRNSGDFSARSESPPEIRPKFGKIQLKNYHKKRSAEQCVALVSNVL